MALPAKTKTWQYANNLNPGYGGTDKIDTDNLFILVKDALKTFPLNPWTVEGSSDGSTAGMDAVDRLIDNGDIVHGGGAHSWIVLQQDAISANTQLLFDFNAGTLQATVVFSPSAGFTGGNTTSRPTATDEKVLANPLDIMWSLGSNNQGSTMRAHVQMSTDGKCTRMFFCANKDVKSWVMVDVPLSPATGWTNPVFAMAPNQNGQVGGVVSYAMHRSTSKLFSEGPSGDMPLWMAFQGFATDGTDSGRLLGEDPWSNPDELSGEFPMAHIGLVNKDTVGMRGWHGYIADMWSTCRNATNGNSFPADGSKAFIILGNFSFPWDGGDIEMP